LPHDPGAGPEPVDIAVGARIRVRRQALGMSQSDLSGGLNLTFQQIQKYERGTNRVSASMLVKIAAILETSVAALVGEDGADSVDPTVLAQFATKGAAALVKALAEIEDEKVRAALVLVAQVVAAGYKRK